MIFNLIDQMMNASTEIKSLKQQLRQADDLECVLDGTNTILYKISGNRFSYPLQFITILNNNTTRYILYILSLVILKLISAFISTLISQLIFDVCSVIITMTILLECNFYIFAKALVTFDVYYKTINILIASIAYSIDCNFFISYYSDGLSLPISFAKSVSSVQIFQATLLILIIANLDGYHAHRYIRIIAIVITSMWLLYYRFLWIFQFESSNAIGYIFGRSFHWHTLGSACMTGGLAFLFVQLYNVIRHSSKLNIIQTLVLFDQIKNDNIDNNINKTPGYESKYFLIINSNDAVYNHLCNICTCKNCIDSNSCSETFKNRLFSTKVFWFCAVYALSYCTITAITESSISCDIFIVLLVILHFVEIIPMLNMNAQLFRFVASNFVFYWKLGDVLIWRITVEFIQYSNKIYIWTPGRASNLAEAYALAIGFGTSTIMAVVIISSIQTFAFVDSWKYKRLALNLSILMAVSYFMLQGIYLFRSEYDYVIDINIMQISCRTLGVGKAIDISLFFLSQLYGNVKFGYNCIFVTGYVERKWKNISKYDIGSSIQFTQHAEMPLIAQ